MKKNMDSKMKLNCIITLCAVASASTLLIGYISAADNVPVSTTISIKAMDENGNPIDPGQLPPGVQQQLQQKISTVLERVANGTITPTVTVTDENGNHIVPDQLPPAAQNQLSAALKHATDATNKLDGGDFDSARMRQGMMANIRDQLGFTNDTEWEAVKPLVQKVLTARSKTVNSFFGAQNFTGGRAKINRLPGDGNSGQINPEREALQKAIDTNAPVSQIKGLLDQYRSSQKAKQARLESAKNDLKAVLTAKQEAVAYQLDLVN